MSRLVVASDGIVECSERKKKEIGYDTTVENVLARYTPEKSVGQLEASSYGILS
jgi:hypothetical protein